MTRRIRSLNKGRLTVWWVTHRQDAIRAMQLVAIVGLYMLASHMDYQDAINAERSARIRAEERLAGMQPIADHPSVAFVIDARTKQDAINRFAEIEGALMKERYIMQRGTK